MEYELALKPVEHLSLSISYTDMKAENLDTGSKLERRPEKQLGANINCLLLKKINLNLNYIYMGDSMYIFFDNITYKSSQRTLDGYYRLDACLRYMLSDSFQLFFRADNVLDEKYQSVYGYAQPGRSFYGGGKAIF
jgi:vitamin B12 transporter